MVTSWAGRGVVSEDHPMNLGSLNGKGLAGVEAFYSSVDLMIVVGSRLRGHETGEFSVPLPQGLVQIDVDPLADGRTYANKLFLRGDARLTLEAMVARISARFRPDATFGDEFRRLKLETRAAFKASLGPYADFAEQLRAMVPARGGLGARYHHKQQHLG
jgi:acetolactate synthase-1/2/3 large subunit